jgi:hypothetical protein
MLLLDSCSLIFASSLLVVAAVGLAVGLLVLVGTHQFEERVGAIDGGMMGA